VDVARDFADASHKKNPKILLVDDDEYFRQHIKSILESEQMEITELSDPGRILETLDFFNPDLLLLDVQMPGITGWDACRMIRSIPRWKNLPVLFLTGESTPSARVECFKAGGDDYIQKPCFKEELLARISLRLERIRLFNERANKDPLTGLLNRRAFLEQVKLKMEQCSRVNRPLSVCIMDLDKFKHVNDTYGHLAGDKVLSAAGKLLLSRFRTVDIRGRWGGEEFAIVFYNEDAETSKKLMNTVLRSFRQITFQGDDNTNFNVSFSAGIAGYPRDGQTFEELFKVADSCLYKAKEAGRNCIYTMQDSGNEN
jgi:diguanylate cyclase (GGDEF)-like protein